jgi:hypothetical protein
MGMCAPGGALGMGTRGGETVRLEGEQNGANHRAPPGIFEGEQGGANHGAIRGISGGNPSYGGKSCGGVSKYSG